ncbi:MAG: hypothetical protein KJ626_12715 [Verrucomicrobia bacterium]|nr:hypothetical protein [Verrucomicrobiota bacterium]
MKTSKVWKFLIPFAFLGALSCSTPDYRPSRRTGALTPKVAVAQANAAVRRMEPSIKHPQPVRVREMDQEFLVWYAMIVPPRPGDSRRRTLVRVSKEYAHVKVDLRAE